MAPSALDELRRSADAQHGVILAAQLRQHGLTGKRIARLVADGWLVAVRPRAYSVGQVTDWRRAVAAALLIPGSALSHGTAARAHRFDGLLAGPAVELTVPLARHPRLDGVVVHRSVDFGPPDVVEHRGVAVTSPARTLFDVAGRYPPALLERVVDEGLVAGLWTMEQLIEAAKRPGRRGVVHLEPVLSARGVCGGADSPLELQAQRALASLAPFETRYVVPLGDRMVQFDIAWPRWKVAVECDGWAVRARSRRKFDADRRKANAAAAAGWTVVHLTSAMTDREMLEAVVRVLLPAVAAGS